MKLKTFFVFIFSLLVVFLSAQEKKLLVVQNGEPQAGIRIVCQETGESCISEATGHCLIANFSTDHHFYSDNLNFKAQAISGDSIANQNFHFSLEKHSVDLDAFVLRVAPVQQERNHQQALAVSAKAIAQEPPTTSADLLQRSGQVAVQQSQSGGGSPILRGFEANRVLLVIDGVRMNNAIYRAGHLQNAITVDPNMLENVEVIFGPGAVVYGSDALGGVIHFHTKDPEYGKPKLQYSSRYNSVSNSSFFNLGGTFSKGKWASLTSASFSNFGNLRIGQNCYHGYSTFGFDTVYVDRLNGQDSIRMNQNPHIQQQTAYEQWDFLQKLVWKRNENERVRLDFQYSTSSNIHRFDQLSLLKGSDPKFAEWYYGPQKRLLLKGQWQKKKETKLFDNINTIVAYQHIQEDRVLRKLHSNIRTARNEDVRIGSLNLDLSKKLKAGTLFYGLEGVYNHVGSVATETDIVTNTNSESPTRYPDGGSHYSNASAYLLYKKPLSNQWLLSSGARYNVVHAQSSYNQTDLFELPFSTIAFMRSAVSGTLGLSYKPQKQTKISATVASGYRNPNVDDYGKFREKGGLLQIPTDQLKPEYAYNGELSLNQTLLENKLSFSLVGFYTLLEHAFIQVDGTLNGQDSIVYDGDLVKVRILENATRALVWGSSFSVKYAFTEVFSFNGSVNYTKGVVKPSNAPYAHIPPIFGRIELVYKADKLTCAAYSQFNGSKTLSTYSDDSSDNLIYATPEGLPAWFTLNYRVSYAFNKRLMLQGAVENILDYNYRTFGSGISAPGRNFMFGLRGQF